MSFALFSGVSPCHVLVQRVRLGKESVQQTAAAGSPGPSTREEGARRIGELRWQYRDSATVSPMHSVLGIIKNFLLQNVTQNISLVMVVS